MNAPMYVYAIHIQLHMHTHFTHTRTLCMHTCTQMNTDGENHHTHVGRPRVLSSRIHSSPEKSMDELTARSNTGLCGNNTKTHFMHM